MSGNDKDNYPQNRLDCLKGKTELTQDDIDCLIEFKNEHPNMSSLMRYTDRNFRDLSLTERRQLLESLIYEHEWLPDAGCYDEYIRYKNCYIATSKLLYDTSDTLLKETAALSRLSDLGYVVYLLPYGFARDGMGCFQKAADSITFGEFLELKSVTSTGKAAGESAYKDARAQANNVYIEGRTFLNFEHERATFLYRVTKNGMIIKMENPSPECFKKINGIAHSNPVILADPTTLHQRGGLPNANVADNMSLVNKKNAKEFLLRGVAFSNYRSQCYGYNTVITHHGKNVYINTISIKLSRTSNKGEKTLLVIAAQVLKQLLAEEKQQLDSILLKKGVTSTKALIKTLTMVCGYAGGRFSVDEAKEAARIYDTSVKMGAKVPRGRRGKKGISTTIFIALVDISYLNKNGLSITYLKDLEEWKCHTATIGIYNTYSICNTYKGVNPAPQADIPDWASKEECCKAIKNIQKELMELGYTMKPTNRALFERFKAITQKYAEGKTDTTPITAASKKALQEDISR